MTDGPSIQAWQACCLASLRGIGVDVVLWIRREPSRSRRRTIGSFAVFRRVFGRARSTRLVVAADLLGDVDVLTCVPRAAAPFGEELLAEDVATIQRYELDAILRFGFGVLRGGVLAAARYGVWSFHHGDDDGYRGSPAAFWELVDGSPLTAVILQRLTERLDAGIILEKGYFPTVRHSYARNLDQILMAAADWPAKIVSMATAGETSALEGRPSTSSTPIRRPPGLRTCLTMAIRLAVARTKWSIGRVLLHDDWSVGVVERDIWTLIAQPRVDDIAWLDGPGSATFLADPFLIDERSMLCEWYDYTTRLGQIAVVERRRDGEWGRPRQSEIKPTVHTSYPAVIHHDGAIWCTPETFAAREVALWRSARPNAAWVRVATLIRDAAVVDPTVVQFDGLWWLFGTLADDVPQAKLRIWWSPDLAGPWLPHAANPVKSDVRSSRPAGPCFVEVGTLYRPAQDSSSTYGGRIAINRVDTLTPSRFSEQTIAWLAPDPDGPFPGGIHTVSSVGGMTVMDGKRRRVIPAAIASEFLRIAPWRVRRRVTDRERQGS